eukprot:COSAG01_NODE_32253_length_584_cov_0.835052_1_plen_128_part_01
MRPARLNLTMSGPGPRFKEVDAGRVSTFGVVPRDEFENIRDILTFGLNDTLRVVLKATEPCPSKWQPSQERGPSGRHHFYDKDHWATAYGGDNVSHHPPLPADSNTTALAVAWEADGSTATHYQPWDL